MVKLFRDILENKYFPILIIILCGYTVKLQAQVEMASQESKYWKIEKITIPEEIILEVGGLAFDNQGRLGVSTRRGEIWIIENPSSKNPIYKRFAHGLHEPLGLAFKDGAFYCSQRGELSKIEDLDADDVADSYETVYRWPLAANYHEYSYGPLILPDGDMIVTLNLGWTGKAESLSKWRGWLVKISPEGEMTPIATGMRSPAGFGVNAEGDLFYAENQGDWVGSGRMTHIESGVFAGHPEGLEWTGETGSPLTLRKEDITDTLGITLFEYAKREPALRPPSIWFPHGLMGISTSDILLLENDDFGPFEGQFLVGDQGHSKIMRVYQEKINGVYQGVCFPFREGFSSGVLRMKSADDHSIYVGMTSRGWSSTGRDAFGLERLTPTGILPFEMAAINAKPDGFEITFTQPLSANSANDNDLFSVSDFTYKYHHIYGSPVIDLQERNIVEMELSADRKKLRLYIEGMREGFIYEIKSSKVKNEKGENLLHNVGYYTLNGIPEGEKRHMQHAKTGDADEAISEITSAKRITDVPKDWTNGPDQSVTLTTVPGLKFDKDEIIVKAGSKIKLTLDNPDDMLHNLLVVKPGTADYVAQQAFQLGLKGQEKGYVPDTEDVLFHTGLLQPKGSDVIYFVAPTTPGRYTYVCTFPGHAATMRGVLVVE